MMTVDEANKIIQDFHNSIRDFRPEGIVRNSTLLPHVSAKIKYAHYIFGEELVLKGIMSANLLKELMESYGLINSLFREDAEEFNIRYRECLRSLKQGHITDFRIPNPFGECNQVLEYYNFIGELLHRLDKELPDKDTPLGAFVYEELRNKAIIEKDIGLFIKIIDTSLTRFVNFPNKKNNDESIFVGEHIPIPLPLN